MPSLYTMGQLLRLVARSLNQRPLKKGLRILHLRLAARRSVLTAQDIGRSVGGARHSWLLAHRPDYQDAFATYTHASRELEALDADYPVGAQLSPSQFFKMVAGVPRRDWRGEP